MVTDLKKKRERNYETRKRREYRPAYSSHFFKPLRTSSHFFALPFPPEAPRRHALLAPPIKPKSRQLLNENIALLLQHLSDRSVRVEQIRFREHDRVG